jgi:arsenic resistance protein ArsH
MTRDFDHYKPHLLPVVPGAETGPDGPYEEADWTANLDLSGATAFSQGVWGERKLRVLVLYGSLRERYAENIDVRSRLMTRSYSKLMALEAARLLDKMGCDVRVYDPQGLPVKDEISVNHEKVAELRGLSEWSEAQFWCSPEQHGTITAVMKNQSGSYHDPESRLTDSRLDPAVYRVSQANTRKSPWVRPGQSSIVTMVLHS